jgi:prepilin-type N-terminal cleavage/methylation domain-containing protein
MRRGFSLIELILALGLILVGFFTFFSVFSTGSHHAIQTRNRAVANLLAQSYLEEFKAHTYGDPAPSLWSEEEDRPLRLVVRGREVQFKFHKEITYKNGSFVGDSDENHDVVKILITWREAVGDSQTQGADDNKKLEAEVPVWR